MGISTRDIWRSFAFAASAFAIVCALSSPQVSAEYNVSAPEVSGHQTDLRLYNMGSSCNELIRRASQRGRYGKPTSPSLSKSNVSILAGGDLPRPHLMKEARKRESLYLEIESGGALATAGYKTEHLPELRGGNGHGTYLRDDGVRIPYKSNPDLLVEGRPFDVYSPVAGEEISIKAISSKVRKQARRIVVNLSRAEGLDSKLVIKDIRGNSRRPKGVLGGLEEVFVIKDGKIIEHLVRSKEGYQLIPYTRPQIKH